ncbi:secreted RxLR effector protein 161-like [Nicotiana tabacum]|uniref:secreted RxLR effector protein 161-like n=1 Tax=Nicotiana tabacum TaxID=4097 RepID=UPI00388CD79B
MEGSKIIDTPIATATRLDMVEPGSSMDETMYRGIIGSLLYFTVSIPNIVFSVGLCARFQSNPKESHLKTVKRILRYLKGTQDLVLYYPLGDNFDLIGYVDSDYTGYLVDRKSTSGMQLEDFGVFSECMPLLCDNTSALNMAKNPVQHKRAKYIDV